MHTASRFEFDTPQPRQGLLRAYGLALLIHGLLAAALTWGVSWRSSDTSLSVEAELWSAVPQQAAPRLIEPEPEPAPEPAPPPPPKVEEPRQSEADIALAREKERQAKEKLEQARLEREKLAREKQEREKLEREKKLAEAKKRKELEEKQARLKEQKETEQREKLRQENLKRMAGLAGATGAPTATGNAQKSSGGISSSYAGRIRARIKPNIAFLDELASNPEAHVIVHTAPDGTILNGDKYGPKLTKSSGNKAWDDAVLKAIAKTDKLPLNEDGVVPSPMTIVFRPKD